MTEDIFIHPNALVEKGVSIGKGSRIWAFAHVLPDVKVGCDCNICDHTFIESGVALGDRVTVKCGVYLWDGVTVEDDVFIGPNATFTNDRTPRSKIYPDQFGKTVLRNGCSIGANATILPGLEVGAYALVGAGSVVTSDVPDHALVFGNPARVRGWVCWCGSRLMLNEHNEVICCNKKYILSEGVVTASDV